MKIRQTIRRMLKPFTGLWGKARKTQPELTPIDRRKQEEQEKVSAALHAARMALEAHVGRARCSTQKGAFGHHRNVTGLGTPVFRVAANSPAADAVIETNRVAGATAMKAAVCENNRRCHRRRIKHQRAAFAHLQNIS